MIQKKELLRAPDGHNISVVFFAKKNSKALVQIVHGMSEHSRRYSEFIEYLLDRDFGVVIHDLRGHGTQSGQFPKGHIPIKGGWKDLLDDVLFIKDWALAQIDVPVILFSHSMGSLIGRTLHKQGLGNYAGFVFSGTPVFPRFLLFLVLGVIKLQLLFFKEEKKSCFWNSVIFGISKRSVKDRVTDFDWISRDSERVQDYIDDPECGYVSTYGLYYHLFRSNLLSMPNQPECEMKNKPILFLSGNQDPIGGTHVHSLANKYLKKGYQNLSIKLFDQGRHELLNETNRREVMAFLVETFKGWG